MKKLCISIGPEWPLAQAELNRVGFDVEKFTAICEDNRVLSFNKSVYECMRLSEGGPSLLFEDDVMFDPGFSSADLGSVIVGYLPSDFMTLHLGCNILGFDNTQWKMPEYFNPKIAKLHNCYQSHATLYSGECVKYILDNFKFITDEYKTEGCEIFDDWLRRNVLNQARSYVLKTMVAYQRPRKSEIWGVESDYTYCHIHGNKWLKNNL